MKRGLISLLFLCMLTLVAAEACQLDVLLLNQDPYPAVQGDYVKLVFQIDGVANSACNQVTFELLEKYPLIFDAGQQRVFSIDSGTYTGVNFQDFFMATYKVRVNSDTLDGSNPIEVRYRYGIGSTQTKEFDIEVEDVRAEFEIFVSDYDSSTKEVTLEILNIGTHDIEALTLEMPEQEGFSIIGSEINIVGDLDSNEDTSADFNVRANSGTYRVIMRYSDSNGERRSGEMNFDFDAEQFSSGNGGSSIWTKLFWVVVIVVVGWFGWKQWKKRKKKRK
jgi:hypothetical protein